MLRCCVLLFYRNIYGLSFIDLFFNYVFSNCQLQSQCGCRVGGECGESNVSGSHFLFTESPSTTLSFAIVVLEDEVVAGDCPCLGGQVFVSLLLKILVIACGVSFYFAPA